MPEREMNTYQTIFLLVFVAPWIATFLFNAVTRDGLSESNMGFVESYLFGCFLILFFSVAVGFVMVAGVILVGIFKYLGTL